MMYYFCLDEALAPPIDEMHLAAHQVSAQLYTDTPLRMSQHFQ